MNNAQYTRNVLRTLSIKPAKLNLRIISKDSRKTNIFHAAVGIATEIGELLVGLEGYILGIEHFEGLKKNVAEELGDALYYTSVMAKQLKYKLPGSGKKVLLSDMTRTHALLTLNKHATNMLDLAKKNFYGPKMMIEEKVRPVVQKIDGKLTKTGKTHKVEVLVVDSEKTKEMFETREQLLVKEFDKFVSVLWPFVYDALKVPPALVMDGNIAKLSERYPDGFFDLGSSEVRDTESELGAMTTMMAPA